MINQPGNVIKFYCDALFNDYMNAILFEWMERRKNVSYDGIALCIRWKK